MEKIVERRKNPRYTVNIQGIMYVNGEQYIVKVNDISKDGICVVILAERECSFEVGELAEIILVDFDEHPRYREWQSVSAMFNIAYSGDMDSEVRVGAKLYAGKDKYHSFVAAHENRVLEKRGRV